MQKETFSLTPKGVIVNALGGMEEEETAKKVVKRLRKYMKRHGKGIVLINGQLEFVELVPEIQ